MTKIKWIVLRACALIASVFVSTVLASFFSSFKVTSALGGLGASSPLPERISMSLYDLQHFGTLFGLFIFAAFLIAFLAGALVFRMTGFSRVVIYSAAGAIAMAVMLWAMEQVFFGVPIVAGARDISGFLLQMLAGGIGGFIFARLTSLKPTIPPHLSFRA
jgi:hypothetical protein